MNASRMHYRVLLLVWLAAVTTGAFAAIAHALQQGRFVY